MHDIAKGLIEHVKRKEWRVKTKGQSHIEMEEKNHVSVIGHPIDKKNKNAYW
jgi:hypothetical protein